MTSRIRAVLAILYLGLSVLLGGASAAGAVANAVLQIAAVLIILLLLWTKRAFVPAEARPLVWAVGLFAGWALVTLVPLPASVWQALPYRGELAEAMRLIGLGEASLPISLAPASTVAALLSLLPPIAMFLLAVTLPPDQRRRLYAAVAILAIASVVLGVFQLIGGSNSGLRFYEITNQGSPVGFFANINHQATLILSALPCVAVFAARSATRRDRSKRSGGLLIATALALFLTAGIALAGSVAGYGLLLPAALASLLIYRGATAGGIGGAAKAGMVALVVAFFAFAFAGPLGQQSLSEKYSSNESSRRVLAERTLGAAAESFPVGTGLGSFASVYRRHENPFQAQRQFANHAHNDYVELVLEQGLIGIAVVALFVFWWGRRTGAAWRFEGPGASTSRAASVIIGLILLHSIVDYPLRTAAIAVILALACAGLLPPPAPRPGPSGAARESGARHLEAS